MRVLITGLGSYWGSRIALMLESEPAVELIVGVDTEEPKLALEKTEFVHIDASLSILPRIVKATQVDTIIHAHLVTDSTEASGRTLHELNVIGTANLLAAAGVKGGSVRKLVMKSSTHFYGSNFDDPYWFREDAPRKHAPRSQIERSVRAAEDAVREFADDERRVMVTRLRFADVLGPELGSSFSRLLQLPVIPEILGFDPRLQFLHEDDAVRALVQATLNQVPGVYNVAADGVLPLSEVCAMIGRRRLPLPPLLTAWAAEPLRRLRLAPLPDELLRVLRYGRGVDSSRSRREGFRYTYTTAATVDAFARWLRLEATVGETTPEYRYEHETEAFFRHSPAVVKE